MKLLSRHSPTGGLKDLVKIKKGGTALDLGAGTGRNSLYLAKHGFRVTAVDKDSSVLKELKAKSKLKGLTVQVKRQTMATFTTRSRYDIVVATGALHFLTDRQVPIVINKMKRFTKVGGYNVIVVHTLKNPKNSRPHLFKHNELKQYYKDWNITKYEEKLGRASRNSKTGNIVQKYIALLVAQKKAD